VLRADSLRSRRLRLKLQPSPNLKDAAGSVLSGVARSEGGDYEAVGWYLNKSQVPVPVPVPVAEKWDGSMWKVQVPSTPEVPRQHLKIYSPVEGVDARPAVRNPGPVDHKCWDRALSSAGRVVCRVGAPAGRLPPLSPRGYSWLGHGLVMVCFGVTLVVPDASSGSLLLTRPKQPLTA
jgi:hypothetical protein